MSPRFSSYPCRLQLQGAMFGHGDVGATLVVAQAGAATRAAPTPPPDGLSQMAALILHYASARRRRILNGMVRACWIRCDCLLAAAPGDGPGMDAVIWIGTSGWMYRDWNGRFYPADLP